MPKPPTANHKLNIDNVTASLKLLAENSNFKSQETIKSSTAAKTQTETEILSSKSETSSEELSVKEEVGKSIVTSSFDNEAQDFLSVAKNIDNYLTDITLALQIMQDHEVNVKEDGISGQLAKITSLGIELGRSVKSQDSGSPYSRNMIEDKEVYLNDPFSGGDIAALSLVAPQEEPIDLDNSQEIEDKDDENDSLSLLSLSQDSVNKSESEIQNIVSSKEKLDEKQTDKNDDGFLIDEDLKSLPDEALQENKLKSELIAKAQEIAPVGEALDILNDSRIKQKDNEKAFTVKSVDSVYKLKTIESDPFDDEIALSCKDSIFSDSDFGYKLILPKENKEINANLQKEISQEEILNFALSQIQKVSNKNVLRLKEQINNHPEKDRTVADLPLLEKENLSGDTVAQFHVNSSDAIENQQVDSEIAVDDSEIDYTDMPLDNSQDMLFYADANDEVVNEIQDGNPAYASKQQIQNAYQQSSQNLLSFKGNLVSNDIKSRLYVRS